MDIQLLQQYNKTKPRGVCKPAYSCTCPKPGQIGRVATKRESGIKWRVIDEGGLLISLDGVAPTRIVGMSASCYPP